MYNDRWIPYVHATHYHTKAQLTYLFTQWCYKLMLIRDSTSQLIGWLTKYRDQVQQSAILEGVYKSTTMTGKETPKAMSNNQWIRVPWLPTCDWLKHEVVNLPEHDTRAKLTLPKPALQGYEPIRTGILFWPTCKLIRIGLFSMANLLKQVTSRIFCKHFGHFESLATSRP